MNKVGAVRHEQKYIISKAHYSMHINKLEPVLSRDEYCKDGAYEVTTLYFDDVYNGALVSKINGDAVRHKYRIRFYNGDTSHIKLERKSKFQHTTRKTSLRLTKEELAQIYRNDFGFLLQKEDELARDFFLQLSHKHLKPKSIVKYNRIAFIHPVGNLRITFDSDIRAAGNRIDLFDTTIHFLPAIEPDNRIMEVKYNGVFPNFVRDLIQIDHIMAAAASKYIFSRKYSAE